MFRSKGKGSSHSVYPIKDSPKLKTFKIKIAINIDPDAIDTGWQSELRKMQNENTLKNIEVYEKDGKFYLKDPSEFPAPIAVASDGPVEIEEAAEDYADTLFDTLQSEASSFAIDGIDYDIYRGRGDSLEIYDLKIKKFKKVEK
jgi:hypothetical protein